MKATEKQKARNRQWYQKTKEARKEHRRRYYQENRERILQNPTRRKRANENRAKLKRAVILCYSNGKCACVRCGFDDIRALTIDHINGGGTEHRRKVKNFYRWLYRNNYPPGYQVLCMNCQFIKKIEEGEHRGKE